MIRFADWTRRGKWGTTSAFNAPAAGVVVHHSVTRVTGSPVADAQTVEEVIWQRRFSSGFSMIAYSFLLHPDGTVLEGRGPWAGARGWRNGANKNTRGGSLSNSNTVSVCCIGDYRSDRVTSVMRHSFGRLLSDLRRDGVVAVDAMVVPHSELAFTECPSAAFDQLMGVQPPPVFDGEDEEDDMVTLHDTTTGQVWVAAGNVARVISDPAGWLGSWNGPTRSHPNMRHVIDDLYSIA